MKPRIPISSGDRFNRLVVSSLSKSCTHGHALWVCKCDCGGDRIARASHLKSGKVGSCGCLRSKPRGIRKGNPNCKREKVVAQGLTPCILKAALDYDPSTGIFKWKEGRHFAGRVAGCVGSGGYRKIAVGGKQYTAHRLAWLYMTGVWPDDMIDHINRVPDDNRFSNLRECDLSQNLANSERKKSNASGYRGVSKAGRKFLARIHIRGRHRNLGMFDTAEEAYEAYLLALHSEHGEFAR